MTSEVSWLESALCVMYLQKSDAFATPARIEHRYRLPPMISEVPRRFAVPLKRLWSHAYRKAKLCLDRGVQPSPIAQSWYDTWLCFFCCVPSKTQLCGVSPICILGRYPPI